MKKKTLLSSIYSARHITKVDIKMDMTLDVFVEGTKNENVGYISQL